jgi:16S rRNA (guanine(966)-N(2))-methyltransferase RsmD
LKTPSRGVRPTSDFVRQALFNLLGVQIENAVFWDLFAGTGAVGLEALSRGARQVIMCEKNASTRKTLERNCKSVDAGRAVEIIPGDALQELPRLEHRPRPDIIFLDPPYAQTNLLLKLIKRLGRSAIAEAQPLLAIEHNSHTELPAEYGGWQTVESRRYGDTVLIFLTRTQSQPPQQDKDKTTNS